MHTEALPPIFTFVLLVAVIYMWIMARKDLNARAIEKQTPTVAELDKVRATVEELIDVLEERATTAERRLSILIGEARLARGDQSGAPSGLRLDAETDPETAKPAKSSRSRRTQTDQFVVVDADPAEETSKDIEITGSAAHDEEDIILPHVEQEAAHPAAPELTMTSEPDAAQEPEIVAGPVDQKPAGKATKAVTELPDAPTLVHDLPIEQDIEIPELYRQVYTLSDSGIDDIVEIARRTGLGQSEVEMVLSLRDRSR